MRKLQGINIHTEGELRKGQALWGFMQWLKNEKQHDDTFYIEDKKLDDYYNEYVKTLKIS